MVMFSDFASRSIILRWLSLIRTPTCITKDISVTNLAGAVSAAPALNLIVIAKHLADAPYSCSCPSIKGNAR